MIQVASWFGMLAIAGLAVTGELTAMGVEIPWPESSLSRFFSRLPTCFSAA